jgi:hypothetical protein
MSSNPSTAKKKKNTNDQEALEKEMQIKTTMAASVVVHACNTSTQETEILSSWTTWATYRNTVSKTNKNQPEADSCNPSYSGGRNQEDGG